jgi:sigma-B regulation protein RsbU (phosphoserine phosphatase)
MRDLSTLLAEYYEATGCEAALWRRGGGPDELLCESSAPRDGTAPDVEVLPLRGVASIRDSKGGERVIAAIPGNVDRWLVVGPRSGPQGSIAAATDFLLPLVSDLLRSDTEVEHAASELAERYEEINLLYTISEILGRTVTMQEATSIILGEISATVGAGRGAILVHDRVTDTLQAVAALGVSPIDAPPIATDDPTSVSATVFKSRRPLLVEDGERICDAEMGYRSGAMLSVPIIWTTPDGGEPLGVVNLSGRRRGQQFTAGDQKLVNAIASQIANAIQNARLVRASLSQQRLVHEMVLAHDLQMRLLPDGKVVSAEAAVAARVVPAESVGGDFYNLFPLPGGRTGAMVGDVSGHGYRAALIMALAMSASAIHAQTTADPGEMLNALRASLQEELLTTEMFISAFYGVIDRQAHSLRFANTGHPHAFIVRGSGEVERLPALDPPMGMSDSFPSVRTLEWHDSEDLLLVFTDGVSDARNRAGARLGEQGVIDAVVKNRSWHPEKILELVIATLHEHTGEGAHRDDLTILLART